MFCFRDSRRSVSRTGLSLFTLIATCFSVFAQTGAQTDKPTISRALAVAAPTKEAATPIPPVTSFTEYAAKFVCGVPGAEAQREAVKPGNYATAINIHNPNQLSSTPAIQFTKHAVLAQQEDITPQRPGPPVAETLLSDFAMEVDCTNIAKLLGTTASFFKGFLVILTPSPNQLDVVGVYSSEPPPSATGGPPAGMGLEVLPIAPRTITK
jgi:hypothetical protein